MSITLRPYQEELLRACAQREGGNTLAVLPTGGGKTPCIAAAAAIRGGDPSVIVAHREVLVLQISMALARAGVPHRLLTPTATAQFVIDRQVDEMGACWLHSRAPVVVAGVDTLVRRAPEWLSGVLWWQCDEAHHCRPENKWGRAAALMPRASGLGWTATPLRADGGRLARAAGGMFDRLVQGPSSAQLVREGYLTPLKAYSLPPSLDRSALPVSSATGDFSGPALRDATHRSRIVGDIVAHYLRIAPGKLGVTFCVDVLAARETAEAYRQRGVPALSMTDETPLRERAAMLEAYTRREVLQLCCVDILGEGFDAPAMEVASMGRATQSLPLCWQQIGRVRRISAGKAEGILIDHVGNLLTHGLPDGVERWELDESPAERGAGARSTPVRQCEAEGCWRAYEGWSPVCPYCGWRPVPVPARRPEEVEGDLTLYGPELMAELRARAEAATRPAPRTAGFASAKDAVVCRNMDARAEAQRAMREAMDWWYGVRRHQGLGETEAYRRFFWTFGVDAASALGLGGPEAARLSVEVWKDLGI
jgi:superfamily II DNA or RNA helicase